MKFKAKASPKQFFSHKGATYKASAGYFITDDKDVISQLSKSPFWEVEKKTEKKAEKPAKEKAEKPIEKKVKKPTKGGKK